MTNESFIVVLFLMCCFSSTLQSQDFDMTVLNAPSTSSQQCFYVHISTDYVADAITISGNGSTSNTCTQEESCPLTVCFDRPSSSSASKLITCAVTAGGSYRQDGCTVLIWPSFSDGNPEDCSNLFLVAECGFMNPCNPCTVPASSITHLTIGTYDENGNFAYYGNSGGGTIEWFDDQGDLAHAGAWVNYSADLAYVRVRVYQSDGSTYDMDCGSSIEFNCNSRMASTPKTQPSIENNVQLGNYPNPFSQDTRFAFSLDSPSPASLALYDLSGKQLAILQQEKQFDAGSHEIYFDGSHLPTGVYFYSLTTKEGTVTNKMNIIR